MATGPWGPRGCWSAGPGSRRAKGRRPRARPRSGRLSAQEQWSLPLTYALLLEYEHGIATLQTGGLFGALEDYASGAWRSGAACPRRRGAWPPVRPTGESEWKLAASG